MKYFQIIFFVIALQSCLAQPTEKLKQNNDDNTLFWEISGKGMEKPSYLYGTFHIMCRNEISISENARKAIDQSGEVYFEMDLDDNSNTLGVLLFMNMKDGKKLEDLYQAEDYNRLVTFFRDSAGVSLKTMQRMKPSVLEALLYPKLMSCKSLSGVEMEILKIAQAAKKEIRGFETVAEQASVFDSIPYEEQARSLLKTIDSFQLYRSDFDSLVRMYKLQQLKGIDEMLAKGEAGLAENRFLMLDKRNMNWVAQLKTILPEKSVFIAVGAGHLVSDMGLISLLRKEGYILRPLLNR